MGKQLHFRRWSSIGRAHGNGNPANLGPEPAELIFMNRVLDGSRKRTGAPITSGLEGAWTTNPDKWDHQYLDLLLNYEWERVPCRAWQWEPINLRRKKTSRFRRS